MLPALSVKPSWAWCIVHAGKSPENRSWPTGHRGWFWLHASAQESHADWVGVQDWCRRIGKPLPPPHALLVRGAIIAAVHLDSCTEARGALTPWETGTPGHWQYAEGYHWWLGEVEPLEKPVRALGRQRWWKPDEPARDVSPSGLANLLRWEAALKCR